MIRFYAARYAARRFFFFLMPYAIADDADYAADAAVIYADAADA